MSTLGDKLKIMAVASAGGHFTQLSLATARYDERFSVLYLTTRLDFVANRDVKISSIDDISRDNLWRAPVVIYQAVKHILDFSPDIVLTTGAAPGLIALAVGRLMGSHTIWIDSCANVSRVSRSGYVASFIAHTSLTQWPELANGRFKYIGSVL